MASLAGKTPFVVAALLLAAPAHANAQGERLSLYGFFDLELEGLLPICGYCPDCFKQHVEPQLDAL